MSKSSLRGPLPDLFRICLLASCLVILATCQSVLADEPALTPGNFSGRVVDLSGEPVAASLDINGAVFETDAAGWFSAHLSEDAVLQVRVSANGYYPILHTFSRAELLAAGASDGAAQISDILLVERKPGRTLFVFGGDTMMTRRFYEPHEGEPVLLHEETVLEDSKALLAEMKPYLELADYASVNLETPIFDELPGEPVAKLVALNSRPETLAALAWAGVDYVALGNNHVYDFEDEGLGETLAQLRQSPLDFSGAGLTEAEALRAHRETLSGTDYDFLSYVGWAAGPPTQIAEPGKGGAAFGSEANVLATTRGSLAGGVVPVLQFHGGLEYVDGPTLEMETRLKQALDDGAGLVIAHHPHVLQGLELYDGRLIAWSVGNFVFDQYFYATQPSMLLYVWMDEGRFHHAEIVPVYLKGYRPTPAVGWMRTAIAQRLLRLSEERGTVLAPSGGHFAVLADQAEARTLTPSPLGLAAQYNTIASPQRLACAQSDTRRRYGRDLLARGDFDAHELFDSPDRSWLDLADSVTIVPAMDEAADLEMEIAAPAGETVATGMRKFTRVYSPGSPMSMAMYASTTAPVRLNLYVQYRGSRQSLSDALEDGEKVLVGSYVLEPARAEAIEAAFDAPRVSVRSIRFLIEAESLDNQPAQLRLDDLAFVEWTTPYLSPAFAPVQARWNSHAQCEPG